MDSTIKYESIIKKSFLRSIEIRKESISHDIPNLILIARTIANSIEKGNKVFFCGNGGSAADAQHLVAELLVRLRPTHNRRPLPAISLAMDSSTLTACGNDFGFEFIFQRTLEALGNKGDVVVGITTSGNSINIVNAFISAKEMGITTVGLLGSTGGDLKKYCDLIYAVKSEETARIQEMHITVGHIVMELIEEILIEQKFIKLK